jgi:sporulation-control protein spo0M
LKTLAGSDPRQYLLFDSDFESGNLDMVFQVDKDEFDMYMRVDSNTRGHHQWFFFKISNQQRVGTVKFNIVNFTKHKSLYMHGMRVNVKSKIENVEKRAKLNLKAGELPNEGWEKACTNIVYKLSKLS